MQNLLCVSVCSVLLATGCSAPRSHVHGTFQYRGKPLAKATIVFLAPDNSTYQARTRPDGSYEVNSVIRGHIVVAIQVDKPRPFFDARTNANGRVDKDSEEKMGLFGLPKTADRALAGFPAHYGDPNKSGLSFDLTEPDQEYSVDLK
jgi:hypothetical protein